MKYILLPVLLFMLACCDNNDTANTPNMVQNSTYIAYEVRYASVDSRALYWLERIDKVNNLGQVEQTDYYGSDGLSEQQFYNYTPSGKIARSDFISMDYKCGYEQNHRTILYSYNNDTLISKVTCLYEQKLKYLLATSEEKYYYKNNKKYMFKRSLLYNILETPISPHLNDSLLNLQHSEPYDTATIFYTYNKDGYLIYDSLANGNNCGPCDYRATKYNEHGDIIQEKYYYLGGDATPFFPSEERVYEYTYEDTVITTLITYFYDISDNKRVEEKRFMTNYIYRHNTKTEVRKEFNEWNKYAIYDSVVSVYDDKKRLLSKTEYNTSPGYIPKVEQKNCMYDKNGKIVTCCSGGSCEIRLQDTIFCKMK